MVTGDQQAQQEDYVSGQDPKEDLVEKFAAPAGGHADEANRGNEWCQCFHKNCIRQPESMLNASLQPVEHGTAILILPGAHFPAGSG
jgi:hypothetical protein